MRNWAAELPLSCLAQAWWAAHPAPGHQEIYFSHTAWLNILWLNAIVKSSITETRQVRGLSSASISFPEVISPNTKKWFSAEIGLFLTICPQLGGLRVALTLVCRCFFNRAEGGCLLHGVPAPAGHELCRPRDSEQKYNHSWWWLQELNMTTWYTLKLQDWNHILCITAVLFPVLVWIKDHRGQT